jgi:hypothetical protein
VGRARAGLGPKLVALVFSPMNDRIVVTPAGLDILAKAAVSGVEIVLWIADDNAGSSLGVCLGKYSF